MGQDMSGCTNPFAYDDEEEEESTTTAMQEHEEDTTLATAAKKKKGSGSRLHRYDTDKRAADEEADKKYARSEGNRYIGDRDL